MTAMVVVMLWTESYKMILRFRFPFLFLRLVMMLLLLIEWL